MPDQSTNEKIADLILRQTYEEGMDLAKFLGDAAAEWVADKQELDGEYFAVLLAEWAKASLLTDEEPSNA